MSETSFEQNTKFLVERYPDLAKSKEARQAGKPHREANG